MNIYADRGNILLLERRCAWRGIGFDVHAASLGDDVDPEAHDLFYLGGGQDRDQQLCAQDLVERKRDALHAAAARRRARSSPSAAATSCSATPTSSATRRVPGIGLVDLRTVREDGPRLIGNVAIEVELPGAERPARARRVREPRRADVPRRGRAPLGRVLRGHGNTGASGVEGVRRGSVIGTYLHGPLLPKNAWFADWLIATALGLEDRSSRWTTPWRTRRTRARAAPPGSSGSALSCCRRPSGRWPAGTARRPPSGPSCRGRRPRSSTASRRWSAAC